VTASPAISVSGLTKAYSETTGIFDVGLEVPAGTVMALLGANGAGKTTALRILSTLLRPDRGTVRVGGIDALTQPDRVQGAQGKRHQFETDLGDIAVRQTRNHRSIKINMSQVVRPTRMKVSHV
jgi:ABC-type multidrug transport system ATPase subunit